MSLDYFDLVKEEYTARVQVAVVALPVVWHNCPIFRHHFHGSGNDCHPSIVQVFANLSIMCSPASKQVKIRHGEKEDVIELRHSSKSFQTSPPGKLLSD